jgi:hypothetical protein
MRQGKCRIQWRWPQPCQTCEAGPPASRQQVAGTLTGCCYNPQQWHPKMIWPAAKPAGWCCGLHWDCESHHIRGRCQISSARLSSALSLTLDTRVVRLYSGAPGRPVFRLVTSCHLNLKQAPTQQHPSKCKQLRSGWIVPSCRLRRVGESATIIRDVRSTETSAPTSRARGHSLLCT